MDTLLIIDMQEATLDGDPKLEFNEVVDRINQLASRVRNSGGNVIFIQHDGLQGDSFEPGTSGWKLLGSLARSPQDLIVRKTLNDAFFRTSLHDLLQDLGTDRLLISGWATDFCVDATVRSAAALGYQVLVASDCHTVSNREHLDAKTIKRHHHCIWTNLISPNPVRIGLATEIYPSRP